MFYVVCNFIGKGILKIVLLEEFIIYTDSFLGMFLGVGLLAIYNSSECFLF